MNLFFKNHLFPVQGKCRISNYYIRNEGIDIATYNQNNPVMASEKGIVKKNSRK